MRVDRYAGGIKPQLPVVELGAWELNSEHMQREVTELAAARATAMTVGLGRWAAARGGEGGVCGDRERWRVRGRRARDG